MQPNVMRWWKKYSLFIKGNRRWKKWGKYTSSTYDRIINRLHHFGKKSVSRGLAAECCIWWCELQTEMYNNSKEYLKSLETCRANGKHPRF